MGNASMINNQTENRIKKNTRIIINIFIFFTVAWFPSGYFSVFSKHFVVVDVLKKGVG